MAIYTVKYRTQTGALAEDQIEAESRSAAFAALKAKGIVPVSLTEGGKKKAAPKPAKTPDATVPAAPGSGSKPSPAVVKGLVAGVVVVVAAVGAWFLLSKPSAPEPVKKPAKKPVKVETAPVAPPPPKPVVTNVAPAVVEETPAEPARDESIPVSVTTNKSGYITEVYIENGKRRRVIKEPPPVFENAADQMIAWMMSAEPGQELPPYPIDASINEDFKNSLTNKITILPTDSPKVVEMKQAVLETRVELLKLMEQGMTVEQALKEHRDLVNENAKIRTDALIEMKRIYDSGDLEGTAQYVTKMNQAFEQMGIQPLVIPGTGEPRPRGRGAAPDAPQAPVGQ